MVVGINYAISWDLWSTIESQLHEIAFVVPLLAYGLVRWFNTRGGSQPTLAVVGPFVFARENLGLTACVVGLVFL